MINKSLEIHLPNHGARTCKHLLKNGNFAGGGVCTVAVAN